MGAIFSSSLDLMRFFSLLSYLAMRCFRKSRHSKYQQLIFSPLASLILEARAFGISGLTLCDFAARRFHRIHRPFHTMTHQRYHRIPGLSIKKKKSNFPLPDLINATTKQLSISWSFFCFICLILWVWIKMNGKLPTVFKYDNQHEPTSMVVEARFANCAGFNYTFQYDCLLHSNLWILLITHLSNVV